MASLHWHDIVCYERISEWDYWFAAVYFSIWTLASGSSISSQKHLDEETDEETFPIPKNKTTTEFLKDLRDKLETARSYSDAHAKSAQQRYVTRYNRPKRSRDKSFTVGESVLVLQKDSTSSKTFSKWIGPAVIFEVQSPNSYMIEFEDGSRRILHANHLRKFHTRTQSLTYSASLMASTNSCAIIHDSDEDFGEICVPDMVEGSKQTTKLPSQKIDHNLLAHLTPKNCYRYWTNMRIVFRRFQDLQRVQSIALN